MFVVLLARFVKTICRAVSPSLSAKINEQPLFIRISTIAACPCDEANMSAVWPRLFIKSRVAPPIISSVDTTCACPLKAAKCKAENPSSFLTSTLSRATVSRRSVALLFPFSAA
uniref:Putative secreted protein n=1 Tax=Panstrongylus lignarius TaxID=156445 RepID=A0A224Y1R1_9HEMI